MSASCSLHSSLPNYLTDHAVPEINRIIKKATLDIVRPQWITDCIHLQELVPLHKKSVITSTYIIVSANRFRYLFHATQERIDAPEYGEDDEDQVADDNFEQAESKAPSVVEDEEAEVNTPLADWFKVEKDSVPKVIENSDTETEDDSDHGEFPPEDGDDEWLKLDASLDGLLGPDTTDVCP